VGRRDAGGAGEVSADSFTGEPGAMSYDPAPAKKRHVPYAYANSVKVHLALATKALGHALPKGAEVHHADGNSLNNTPSNLVICPSRAYHMLLHHRMRIQRRGGNPNTDAICSTCDAVKPVSEMGKRKHYPPRECKACILARVKARYREHRAKFSTPTSVVCRRCWGGGCSECDRRGFIEGVRKIAAYQRSA
jgi:hypothetical protein